MEVLLIILRKYWGYLALSMCIIVLLNINHQSKHEIEVLESQIKTEKLERDLAHTTALNNLLVVQNKYEVLAKQREEEYAKEYKKLLDAYSTLDASVNSLSNTTKTIRDTVRDSSTTTETRIEYIDRYETAFNSCVGEYSEMAKRFDEADHKTKQLNDYVDSIHLQIKEFNDLYKKD